MNNCIDCAYSTLKGNFISCQKGYMEPINVKITDDFIIGPAACDEFSDANSSN